MAGNQDTREVELHISDLVMDSKLQVRNKLDDGTIMRYVAVIKSEKEMPPIRVALVNKMHLLIDGWHRVEAHKFIGKRKIKAIVVEATRSDAKWMAAQANLEHGLPLKSKELQNVFKAYIESKQHMLPGGYYKSYRQIGREIGKTHHTIISWTRRFYPQLIGKMMSEDAGSNDFPRTTDDLSNYGEEVQQVLDMAYDGFQATSDPAARGWIIDYAEALVDRMKQSGGYIKPDF